MSVALGEVCAIRGVVVDVGSEGGGERSIAETTACVQITRA